MPPATTSVESTPLYINYGLLERNKSAHYSLHFGMSRLRKAREASSAFWPRAGCLLRVGSTDANGHPRGGLFVDVALKAELKAHTEAWYKDEFGWYNRSLIFVAKFKNWGEEHPHLVEHSGAEEHAQRIGRSVSTIRWTKGVQ
ncbi:hypothetical protein DL767_001123 [Monosporascus sp. MG133]|nr:hypothetical protein DL767_001123 [Monosporascus sp. MG133]